MTLKIEVASDGRSVVLRLIGRLDAAYLGELEALLARHGPPLALDLDQVTLVDVEVVRLLARCEEQGVELLNPAPYVREWMNRERNHGP